MRDFLIKKNLSSVLGVMAFLLGQSPSYAQSEPSIKSAGADLANFPNSAFTLPEGQAYVEVSPVNYSGSSANAPSQYSAGYLLRYGLFDDLELRLMSSGITVIDDAQKTTGMSAQTFDFKWHLADANEEMLLPAVGLEFALQTNLASRAFQGGTNPSLSLNFDQRLPYEIDIEYNLGFVSQQNEVGQSQYQLALSWAIQREIVTDVAVFANGYTNTANGLTTSAIGAGLQWIPVERLALFANVSGGVTKTTPSVFSLVGFAVAF
ncbi:MAG TPA: hypothetical protein DF614_01135 [Methylococcaceae bacterium]|nr:hypothetical protein [Methylococcaceae bacterium]